VRVLVSPVDSDMRRAFVLHQGSCSRIQHGSDDHPCCRRIINGVSLSGDKGAGVLWVVQGRPHAEPEGNDAVPGRSKIRGWYS
jgi:hypothetical protein